MSFSKQQKKKYGIMINAMKELGFEEYQIQSKITEKEELEGYRPITLKELIEMKEKDLKTLLSYTWKEGTRRCCDIGIQDLKITKETNYYYITYGDDSGNPRFSIRDEKEKIFKVGDGTWDYGLFKKQTLKQIK